MSIIKSKISITKAALVGAMISVAAILLQHGMEPMLTSPRGVGYWGGVALGGALFGMIVAAFINRNR